MASQSTGEFFSQVYAFNGCEHTFAVTNSGTLHACGYNYRGQLGLGNTNSESYLSPVKSLRHKRVANVACSYHHSLVICSDGSAYSFGRNDSGQLGLGDYLDRKQPTLIESIDTSARKAACGQFHSIMLNEVGEVLSCGKNDYGQLALTKRDVSHTFTKIEDIPFNKKIIHICCGYYHTLLLSYSGHMYGCGRNDYGQLGYIAMEGTKVFTKIDLSIREKTKLLSCTSCTTQYSIVLYLINCL